jgi:hypothetical protein
LLFVKWRMNSFPFSHLEPHGKRIPRHLLYEKMSILSGQGKPICGISVSYIPALPGAEEVFVPERGRYPILLRYIVKIKKN